MNIAGMDLQCDFLKPQLEDLEDQFSNHNDGWKRQRSKIVSARELFCQAAIVKVKNEISGLIIIADTDNMDEISMSY